MKKCSKCDTILENETNFCPKCGYTEFEDLGEQAGTQSAGNNSQQPNNGQYNQQYNNQGYSQPYNNQGYGQQPYNQGYGQQPYYGRPTNPSDASNTGYSVLSFFVPLIGLILYLIWKDEYPLRAKSCSKGALIGFIVSVVGGIIYAIAMGSLIGSAMDGYYGYLFSAALAL